MSGVTEETTGAEYAPEAAFAAALSGGQMLFGEPLAKFSTSRAWAAQKMGCQAPGSFHPENYKLFRRTLQYPGIQEDVAKILWLCTLPDELATAAEYRAGAMTPDLALNRPAEANKQARDWAERVGIAKMTEVKFEEAWKAFLEIVFAIDASYFQVKEDRGGAPAGGAPLPKTEPGHPNSRSSSHGSPGNVAKRRRSSGEK